MKSPYKSKPVKILDIKNLNYNTKLFTLDINLKFKPGQFVMAGLPGFGEAAFSLPANNQLAIRKVGTVTSALHQLKKGDKIFIRGPYGNGWPKAEGDLLLIAGGLGLVALRPLCSRPRTILFYGACRKDDLIFKNEYDKWCKIIDFYLVLEEPAKAIKCDIGLVTDLFDKVKLPKNITAFLCGPPIMYKFVIKKLKALKIKKIYLSLERRMSCGTGICQHCAISDYYVCKHGPVFNFNKLRNQKF